MSIPKNVPKRIFTKQWGVRKVRKTWNMPEELYIALGLYATKLENEGVKDASPSTANTLLLYKSRTVQDLLPQARAIIKAKQEQTDDRNEGGSS